MKKLFFILSIVFISGFSQAQTSVFEGNPPSLPPAIFEASMPPCLIGVASQYGENIGVSNETLEKASAFIKEAHKEVPKYKKQVRELELQLMKASKEERYDDYEKLLHQLSDVKIKASLFHEGLVKRARKEFKKEDIQKLDDFIQKNQDIFLGSVKLN